MPALQTISTKIGYVFAIVIIVTAILVVGMHLFTPILNKHRAEFEKYASDILHRPVTIQNVEISWYRYQPEITLNAVTVFDKESKEPQLQVQKASIFFSLPKSLWEQKLVPSGIMLSGTEINIKETNKG